MFRGIRATSAGERQLLLLCVVALLVTLYTLPLIFTGPLAGAVLAGMLARRVTRGRRRGVN